MTGHRRVGLLRSIAGWVLIVVGVLGIFLPMLPAIVFLPAGVALVGRNSRVIQFTRTRTKLFLRRAETWNGAPGRVGRWLAKRERRFGKKLRDRRMRRHAA